ncbi:MAG: hypothetical protein KGZ73_05275 [Rhizobiales bacterium]|nr:hypothetical protein [Hyphomicrobiales bacterium]
MTEFHAKIEKGEVVFPSMKASIAWKGWKETHDGVSIVISEDKPSRSRSQNSFYWTYLEVIARDTGDNADDLHEFFKRKLLAPVFKTIRGEEVKLPRSTTDLDKLEFTEYLDKIAALTGIPIPDPAAAGFTSDYSLKTQTS